MHAFCTYCGKDGSSMRVEDNTMYRSHDGDIPYLGLGGANLPFIQSAIATILQDGDHDQYANHKDVHQFVSI